jgi:uncharacterized tellurite resistance protein B-like protein
MRKLQELNELDLQVTRDLRQFEVYVNEHGRVDGPELEQLRQTVYAGGKVPRERADSLVALHKQVRQRTRAFEEFFYNAIKDHLLADGRIDAEEAAWLRQMLFADHKIDDEERKFLHQLRGEAREVSPEFEALFREAMKQPPERHTAG